MVPKVAHGTERVNPAVVSFAFDTTNNGVSSEPLTAQDKISNKDILTSIWTSVYVDKITSFLKVQVLHICI
jgi:hypothetical protein